ncbi:MAG: anti-sigma factor antagonist [Nitrospirae bacterium]|nr:MAG: anti-sigma factor antagonist [Nitrospirota bacterium]
MEIRERMTGDALILDMRGRFEFHTTPHFLATLDRVENSGCQKLILNLREVPYLDSAALGLLHFAHQKLMRLRGHISILNPQPHIQRLLESANIPSIIPIHTVEEQALLVG